MGAPAKTSEGLISDAFLEKLRETQKEAYRRELLRSPMARRKHGLRKRAPRVPKAKPPKTWKVSADGICSEPHWPVESMETVARTAHGREWLAGLLEAGQVHPQAVRKLRFILAARRIE